MSEHPKCWASDNSLLPSQLQFRQDSAMFPVMAMPGYFLLVLMRPCILKEIMLIRDSKTHTSLYLVLFWVIHGVLLWFVPKLNCADFCMSAVVQSPTAPWGKSTQKTGVSLLCSRDSGGKWGQGDLLDEGTLLPGKCPRMSPSCLCGGKSKGHLS